MACSPNALGAGIASRRNYIVVHHTTASQSSTALFTANSTCTNNPDNTGYDYQVNANGSLYVGGRALVNPGCHATGCNCQSLGIGVQGCYSPAECPGEPTTMTTSQVCGIATVSWWNCAPNTNAGFRPHRYCVKEHPCGGTPVDKRCPGTTYTSATDSSNGWWNSTGVTLRSQIKGKRASLENCGNCNTC
jgi:hypothetical protein